MNCIFLSLLRLIKKYGSFSHPFINHVLENNNLSKAENAWIKSIKYEEMYSYKTALNEVKVELNACSDENLKFLLLSEKLELFRFLRRNKMADRLYSRMRKDLSLLSPSVRDLISVEFAAHRASFRKEEDCLGKISQETKILNDSAKAFLEINIGRNLARNGNMEGLEHFKKGLDIAETIPHPSEIITAANAIAWYRKEYDLDESVHYAKDALIGWDGILKDLNSTSSIPP